MEKDKVKSGDVFLAHNKYMHPPKEKFHLCINERMYFLINTKPHTFNSLITPDDCSFLTHDSYINCGIIRCEPIKEFKIIKKEQLSQAALRRLIEKIEIVPTLTPIQIKEVITDLKKCLI